MATADPAGVAAHWASLFALGGFGLAALKTLNQRIDGILESIATDFKLDPQPVFLRDASRVQLVRECAWCMAAATAEEAKLRHSRVRWRRRRALWAQIERGLRQRVVLSESPDRRLFEQDADRVRARMRVDDEARLSGRRNSRAVRDNLLLQVKHVVERRTRLTGEAAETLVARILGLASSDAVHRRHARINPEMRARWKDRHSLPRRERLRSRRVRDRKKKWCFRPECGSPQHLGVAGRYWRALRGIIPGRRGAMPWTISSCSPSS